MGYKKALFMVLFYFSKIQAPQFTSKKWYNNFKIGNLSFQKQDFDTYEIGYVFNKKYQKQGLAAESAKAIINYAIKELNARRIIRMCSPKNDSSWKLLERLKMRREGHLLQNVYFKTDEHNRPIWLDTYEYAILASEM